MGVVDTSVKELCDSWDPFQLPLGTFFHICHMVRPSLGLSVVLRESNWLLANVFRQYCMEKYPWFWIFIGKAYCFLGVHCSIPHLPNLHESSLSEKWVCGGYLANKVSMCILVYPCGVYVLRVVISVWRGVCVHAICPTCEICWLKYVWLNVSMPDIGI